MTAWKITELNERDENNCPRYNLVTDKVSVLERELYDKCWQWVSARIQPDDYYIEENAGCEPVELTYEQFKNIDDELIEFEAGETDNNE